MECVAFLIAVLRTVPMKTPLLALIVLMTLSAFSFGEEQAGKTPSESKIGIAESASALPGRQAFEQICMACHKYERQLPMLAPPVFAVKDHYIRMYSTEQDFVNAIVTFASKPDAKKSLMPGAIAKFNLMPPLPLPREQLESIASFIFRADLTKPDWYDAHYKEEHGEEASDDK